MFGGAFDKWFAEALTLLVIACPCALVISTPISIYAAIGNASGRGALIKGGKYIEALGQIKAIALDKTRTLTHGKPVVTDVLPFGEATREHLLACAAGIESYSEHPLAQSIVQAARNEKLDLHQAENFQAVLGKGVKADCVVCYDKHHCIGKLPFITEEHHVQDEVVRKVEELQKSGKTSIVVSSQDEVEGIIALADTLKEESKAAIEALNRLGRGDDYADGRQPRARRSRRQRSRHHARQSRIAARRQSRRDQGTSRRIRFGRNGRRRRERCSGSRSVNRRNFDGRGGFGHGNRSLVGGDSQRPPRTRPVFNQFGKEKRSRRFALIPHSPF